MDWKPPEKGAPFTQEYLFSEIKKFKDMVSKEEAWKDPKSLAVCLRAILYVWVNLKNTSDLIDHEIDGLCEAYRYRLNTLGKPFDIPDKK